MDRIVADGLSKRFKIGYRKHELALAKFLSLFSGKEPTRLIWAIDDVSFKVGAGEVVGIIGKNGSGKSTLLRVIAGIYTPDKGKVRVEGKIISLINLNIGLKEKLTTEENIYICCALFGISQAEAALKAEEIIDFAELRDFAGTKIYQFSEGMKQRLIFSIALFCNPDIFLLDEVFEVGDEDFKAKSVKKVKEYVADGAAVILVSHDLDMMRRYCDRALWMGEGRIIRSGDARDIIDEYKLSGAHLS